MVLGQPEAAVNAHVQALEQVDAAFEDHPESVTWRMIRVRTLLGLGEALRVANQPATEPLEEGLALAQELRAEERFPEEIAELIPRFEAALP